MPIVHTSPYALRSLYTYLYFPTKPTKDTSLVLSSIHSLPRYTKCVELNSYLNAIA